MPYCAALHIDRLVNHTLQTLANQVLTASTESSAMKHELLHNL